MIWILNFSHINPALHPFVVPVSGRRHSAVEIKWLFRDKQLIAHKFLPSLTSVFLCAPAGQKAWGAQICLLHHNKFSQRPSEARLKFRRGSCLKVKCLNHNVPKRESVFLPIECWASLEWFRVDSEERMIVSIAINRSLCMFVWLVGCSCDPLRT